MYNFAIFYRKNGIKFRIDIVKAITAEIVFNNLVDQMWTSQDTEISWISMWNIKSGDLLEELYLGEWKFDVL